MNFSDPQSIAGKDVVGADGEKIGKVEELYLDTQTEQPEWISVSTGFFGSHVSLVPTAEASQEDGGIRVPYSKDQVKSAPHYDPGRELSEEEEADVFRHYGLSYGSRESGEYTGEQTTARGDFESFMRMAFKELHPSAKLSFDPYLTYLSEVAEGIAAVDARSHKTNHDRDKRSRSR